MTTTDFSTTMLVDQTPKKAFQAINNVRGWWSEEIEGSSDELNAVFNYHYKDVHRCSIKIVEFVPDKKVVWHVLDNYFNFIQDKTEWKDTKMIFEITRQNDKTQIRFTHEGLVPEYECFDICSNAWSQYVGQSLRSLITTGKGQPNPIEEVVDEAAAKADTLEAQDYHARIAVDAPAHEVFKAINSVAKWWTDDLTGSSEKLNDEFTVRFGNVHVSTQRIVEMIPDKKVVWLVTDSNLNFVKDKHEWTNTKISFELFRQGNKTEVDFAHFGLTPQVECYEDCAAGWDHYIKGSLFKVLTHLTPSPSPNGEGRRQ